MASLESQASLRILGLKNIPEVSHWITNKDWVVKNLSDVMIANGIHQKPNVELPFFISSAYYPVKEEFPKFSNLFPDEENSSNGFKIAKYHFNPLPPHFVVLRTETPFLSPESFLKDFKQSLSHIGIKKTSITISSRGFSSLRIPGSLVKNIDGESENERQAILFGTIQENNHLILKAGNYEVDGIPTTVFFESYLNYLNSRQTTTDRDNIIFQTKPAQRKYRQLNYFGEIF